MGDDSEQTGRRFADPDPEWKRFRPLTLDEDGEPVIDEKTLEEGWSGEPEPETPIKGRWSLAWVAAVSVVTLVAMGVLAYKYSNRPSSVADKPIYRSVAERRSMVGDQLADFFAATTTEGRLAEILEPRRLRPMLDEYYSREGVVGIELDRIDEVKAVRLEGQPWLWIGFTDKQGSPHVAAFKDTPGGFKLDWESLVAYGELPWEELSSSRPTEPTQMRVYLRRGNYFNWKYQDREKYVALEIEPRGPGKILYGYVERGSDVHGALARAVPAGARQPANIRLHFEEDAGAENLAVIDELIHNLWVAPSILDAAGASED